MDRRRTGPFQLRDSAWLSVKMIGLWAQFALFLGLTCVVQESCDFLDKAPSRRSAHSGRAENLVHV
jgi:hypothetical protein